MSRLILSIPIYKARTHPRAKQNKRVFIAFAALGAVALAIWGATILLK